MKCLTVFAQFARLSALFLVLGGMSEVRGDTCAALAYAAEFMAYKNVGDLISAKAVEEKTSVKELIDNCELLSWASKNQNNPGIRWLLENNADINKAFFNNVSKKNETPIALLEDAIIKGLLLWDTDLGDGNTMLHAAALGGNVAAVKWLIEKGATVDFKNTAGHTPLHKAIIGFEADLTLGSAQQRSKDYLDVIKKLLDAGADPAGIKMDNATRVLIENAGVSFISSTEILKKLAQSLQAIVVA
ncbi:MAG: hypothetical protein UW09_C0001G0344 [candidate division TM6 bacterium GW2011_GWF2_43_87]|nr:MAG: hypothetical protein UW09_C0001G0344 [candidate division TM6 bacterium GW2011_GWF2_43_87]